MTSKGITIQFFQGAFSFNVFPLQTVTGGLNAPIPYNGNSALVYLQDTGRGYVDCGLFTAHDTQTAYSFTSSKTPDLSVYTTWAHPFTPAATLQITLYPPS